MRSTGSCVGNVGFWAFVDLFVGSETLWAFLCFAVFSIVFIVSLTPCFLVNDRVLGSY